MCSMTNNVHGKKIVLPGGAGLVGQNLVISLKDQGYNNITVIDNHSYNLTVLKKLHPGVSIINDDLSKDGSWKDAFRDASIVVMLQAEIASKHKDNFRRNNIDSTVHIIDAMKTYNVSYLVHISSSVVESVLNDDYTITKTEQENIVINNGLDNVILRPTLMFGWFDRKNLGWLSRFMKRVPLFPIPGSGKYMRQPLYVRDFCNIIISCLETRPLSSVYNISGIEKINYIDIIKSIRDVTNSNTIIFKIPFVLFRILIDIWAFFDPKPPFTPDQVRALVVDDAFDVIPWPEIFSVHHTPFSRAIDETYTHPIYSKMKVKF